VSTDCCGCGVGERCSCICHRTRQTNRYAQAWFLFVDGAGELSTDVTASRITVGATHAGRVRVIVPEGLALTPAAAERLGEHIAEAAVIARNPEARFTPGPAS
jgi:hypothetical protein